MTPVSRRIFYAISYEALGVGLTTAALVLFGAGSTTDSLIAAIGSTAIALAWSLAFNTAFEGWERGQRTRGRSWRRRIAHAVLYEAGLVVLLVPVLAWWLVVPLWQALLYDLGLVAFFAVYTLVFTWAFDRIFGLPQSAR